MDSLDMLIGQRMRTLRKERGIKQAEAAEKIGVTEYTISRMENGRHHTKEETINSLCGLYGVAYEDFMRSVFEKEE